MKNRSKRYLLGIVLFILSTYIIIYLLKWNYFYSLSSRKPFEHLSSLSFVFTDSNGARHNYFMNSADLTKFRANTVNKHQDFRFYQEIEINSSNLFSEVVHMSISSNFRMIKFTMPSVLHNNEVDIFIELDDESSVLLCFWLSQYNDWTLSTEAVAKRRAVQKRPV
jgi:hypothetical protein